MDTIMQILQWAIPSGGIGGKLTLTEVTKVECQLKVNKPTDGSAPYDIQDTVG